MSIFPLVKSLFKAFTLSFNFDVKDVFWSSKFGKNIRAFIAIASYSDLNVQLFIRNECLAIYLEGSKNRNFFQWTTVLYTSSNLFFITSLSAFQMFSSSTVTFERQSWMLSQKLLDRLLVFLGIRVCVDLALVMC